MSERAKEPGEWAARAKELLSQLSRYLKEAYTEWRDGVEYSPESHLYTFITGVASATALRWIL